MERGIDALFHAVAIGEARQGVELGETVCFFLCAEVVGDIDNTATKASELGLLVIERPARQAEHGIVTRVFCLNRQIRKRFASVQLQAERAPICFALNRDQYFLKSGANYLVHRHAQPPSDRRRQVSDIALFIGRPETQRSALLNLVDDAQLVFSAEIGQPRQTASVLAR